MWKASYLSPYHFSLLVNLNSKLRLLRVHSFVLYSPAPLSHAGIVLSCQIPPTQDDRYFRFYLRIWRQQWERQMYLAAQDKQLHIDYQTPPALKVLEHTQRIRGNHCFLLGVLLCPMLLLLFSPNQTHSPTIPNKRFQIIFAAQQFSQPSVLLQNIGSCPNCLILLFMTKHGSSLPRRSSASVLKIMQFFLSLLLQNRACMLRLFLLWKLCTSVITVS